MLESKSAPAGADGEVDGGAEAGEFPVGGGRITGGGFPESPSPALVVYGSGFILKQDFRANNVGERTEQ